MKSDDREREASGQALSRLVEKLRADFSNVKIKEAGVFYWNPYEKEVGYLIGHEESALLLLHELAHTELGHEGYEWDMELLQMESAAWRKVRDELSGRYGVRFDSELALRKLETYRDWFWERSSCPGCGTYGFQGLDAKYACRACQRVWRPNDNRFKRVWRKGVDEKRVFCDFSEIDKLLQF